MLPYRNFSQNSENNCPFLVGHEQIGLVFSLLSPSCVGWQRRLKAPTLMRMMPHESIQTTMAFYVDLDADEIAEDLYRVSGRSSTVSGTVLPLGRNARTRAAT